MMWQINMKYQLFLQKKVQQRHSFSSKYFMLLRQITGICTDETVIMNTI